MHRTISTPSHPESIGQEPGTGIETGGKAPEQKVTRRLGRSAFQGQKKSGETPPNAERTHEAIYLERLRQKAFGHAEHQLRSLEYLVGENIYSYSKSLPRRSKDMFRPEDGFDGSYDQLAADTLDRVLSDGMAEDGSFELLSTDTTTRRLAELMAGTPDKVGMKPAEAYANIAADRRYHDGVPVVLWKLGVMKFEDEQSFLYGKGESFVHDVTKKLQGTTKSASMIIPFDAQNDLHQRIAKTTGQPVDSLELDITGSYGGSYDSLRLRTVAAQEFSDAA